jgi:hypothetical protein
MTQIEVQTLHEPKRGCGYRHTGADGVGIYLMGELLNPGVCELLPWALDTCPCCGGGVKFARAWTSITPASLFVEDDTHPGCMMKSERYSWTDNFFPGSEGEYRNHVHLACPMCNPPLGIHGLVWAGHTHYTAASFAAEALERGVSKRLPSIPRDLEIGKTVVYVAHIKACGNFLTGEEMTPGVFMAFRPTHIDLVVDDEDDVPEKAVNLLKRHEGHAQLVKVVPE